jgi:membrane protein YqaA with SNARE-associated domain
VALLSLLVYSFAGSIVWVFNVEAAAVVAGASGSWHPLLVGATCAVGQALGYTLLYFAGEVVFRHWRWGQRKVEWTRRRYGDRLRTGFYGLTFTAALAGLPPLTAMAALAGGLPVRYLPMIAILLPLRIIRFTVLAAAGEGLLAWWRGLF